MNKRRYGDGWSEMYRAQDEAEAERRGMWICPECGEWCDVEREARCACGYPFDDDDTDEEELEYAPLWATIAGPMERLNDEWADEHERDDSEGWDDES